MSGSLVQHILVAFLLLTKASFAARYKYSFKKIVANQVRSGEEDSLHVIIGSVTNYGNQSETWDIGLYSNENNTIELDYLFKEIEVPPEGSNLSIGISVVNQPQDLEDSEDAEKYVTAVLDVAALVPGPVGIAADLLSTVVQFFGDLFSCDGPVVFDNIVYSESALRDLEQNETICDTKNYTLEADSSLSCSNGSNYTVTYCLERLDAKPDSESAAMILASGLPLFIFSMGSAVFCMLFALYL